ncbi:MAG: hypothetical protein HKN42_13280 [Granulosicoccus sp.]|nr:hypothetical protein [Granulosicoccus sp.]
MNVVRLLDRKAVQRTARPGMLAPLLAVFLLQGAGSLHAFPSIWEAESLDFTSGSGTFDCATGCHTVSKVNSLQMSAPASVSSSATSASVSLTGFQSGNKLASFRYQIAGGAAVDPIDGVRPPGTQSSTSRNISFKLTDSPVIVRYCLVDANDNTRRWNCGTQTIVRDAPPNQPPTITSSVPPNQDVIRDSTPFAFTVTATDDNSTPVISAESGNTSVVTVSGSAPNFSLNFVGAGSTTVVIRAIDGASLEATQSFTVKVTNPVITPVDEPPQITSANPGNLSLTAGGDAYSFTVTAVDDESVPVVSVSSSNPLVVQVTPGAAGSYKLTPLIIGSSTISIVATDSNGGTDTQTFKVTVKTGNVIPPTVNLPPSIQFEGVISGVVSLMVGDIYAFGVTATDDKPESLTFQASSSNASVATGSFTSPGTLTVDAVGAGSAKITLTVTDAGQLSASISVDIQVTVANTAPLASADTFVIAAQDRDIVLDVLSNDTDGDGDALVIVLDSSRSAQGNALTANAGAVRYQTTGALLVNDSFSYRVEDASGAQSGSVVVTLMPSDQDDDGAVDAVDNCPSLSNTDQADMDSDSLGDLCDPDPDGDGEPGISGIPFESGRELVEAVCLTCHLNGTAGAPRFNDEEAWNQRIADAGGAPEDMLGSVLNGKGAMQAFGDVYSTQDLIQAIRYLSGREESTGGPTTTPEDRDLDEVADSDDNCPDVPNPSQSDNDSDGVGDACEPLADRDQDGYPFAIDDDDGNANRLLATLPVVTNGTVFTSTGGLRLGRIARAVAQASGYQSASVILSQAAFTQGVGQVFPGINVSEDGSVSSLMGIMNIDVGASSGEAMVILQLGTNLPLNPVIRVFDSGSGDWRNFNDGGNDQIASAPATDTGCPARTSANYVPGLASGLSCVRISVQDGGPNDADGTGNGRVELMMNIARARFDDPDNGPDTVDISPSKGGGGVGYFLLALLLFTGLARCPVNLLRMPE